MTRTESVSAAAKGGGRRTGRGRQGGPGRSYLGPSARAQAAAPVHASLRTQERRPARTAAREETSSLSAAAFPPRSSSDWHTPQSLSYSASIALPVSHMRSRASSEASSSQTPIPTQVAHHSDQSALALPKQPRVLYTSLRATYNDARQTILSQAEELASLKSFLSKTLFRGDVPRPRQQVRASGRRRSGDALLD